jgi:DNA modification methylase
MNSFQYSLPIYIDDINNRHQAYRDRLVSLLSQDLDFHSENGRYSSHNLHSFPAKFPPQLPRKFITGLTEPSDVVLDPMVGSGTTILEALLARDRGIGFDIDPLSLMISQVKITPLIFEEVIRIGNLILKQARLTIHEKRHDLNRVLENRWDIRTKQFVEYWFTHEIQLELLALITEIEKIDNPKIRAFFKLVFSAIIITKSGGVSSAFDLAHTRPHKAKFIVDRYGEPINDSNLVGNPQNLSDSEVLTKTLRSPIVEFEKRFKNNVKDLLITAPSRIQPCITFGDAQSLPLRNSSVDLIVTSPPYVANAIDYMRAHKFSLVWMGYPIETLGQTRRTYIGGDFVTDIKYEKLPEKVAEVVADITTQDKNKGQVLHRYYSEMTRILREMYRVLKPGKAAIIVVGSSIMRGRDTETHTCLESIGRTIGFDVPMIGVRKLDRDRRMMPAGAKLNLNSQIQQRIHEEYVIGLYKPEF